LEESRQEEEKEAAERSYREAGGILLYPERLPGKGREFYEKEFSESSRSCRKRREFYEKEFSENW
jgi:hypothetical protein